MTYQKVLFEENIDAQKDERLDEFLEEDKKYMIKNMLAVNHQGE